MYSKVKAMIDANDVSGLIRLLIKEDKIVVSGRKVEVSKIRVS